MQQQNKVEQTEGKMPENTVFSENGGEGDKTRSSKFEETNRN